MADGESKTELAEDRTDWAEDRTVLANERTFAGWMRTGLAAVGVALGFKAVFGSFEPLWVAKAVSSAFVAAALLIYWAAWKSAHATRKRMSEHEAESLQRSGFDVIAAFLAAASLAAGAVLWLL